MQDNFPNTWVLFCLNGALDGNKTRKLLDPDKRENLLLCLNDTMDDQTRTDIGFVVQEISYIYTVVASHSPKDLFCLQEFQTRANKLLVFIKQKYSWWNCGSYLHIAACHTVEILKTIDSIGLYSTEVSILTLTTTFDRLFLLLLSYFLISMFNFLLLGKGKQEQDIKYLYKCFCKKIQQYRLYARHFPS